MTKGDADALVLFNAGPQILVTFSLSHSILHRPVVVLHQVTSSDLCEIQETGRKVTRPHRRSRRYASPTCASAKEHGARRARHLLS